MASCEVSPAECNEVILKSGFMYKQGGGYRSWKKRFFILRDSTLCYYVKEGEESPKGTISLHTGRGVRSKPQCTSVEEWPKAAKGDVTFGVAVEARTYYLYGSDADTVKDWKKLIQQRIEKIGNPTNAYDKDAEGKPEKITYKLVKQGTKIATKVTKLVAKNSGVDQDKIDIVEGVADAAENQADAGRDATVADRLKMATGDTAGIVGDNVDNQYVSTAASVVKEQAEADDDVSMQQRLLMGAGTTLGGVAEIVGEENQIAGAAVGVVGGVVHDQGEADEDMSVKQRLLLAGGSALSGGGGAVGDLTGVDVAADVLDVAGGVVKDQAEADEDTSWKERAAIAVGSTANGVADLDSMRYNYEAKAVCRSVNKMAEEIQEDLADDKE